jgi:multiple sugar transport system ATP-binding protein
MNFIPGIVDEKRNFKAGKQVIEIPADKFEILKAHDFVGKELILGIRPEDIHDDEVILQTYPKSQIEIVVDVAELLGAETNIYTTINDSNIVASVDARADVSIGDKLTLGLDMNKIHFFDPQSEQRLVLKKK